MKINRGFYRLCVVAMWAPVGICVTGVVLTRAENPDSVALLTASSIIAIPAQLFVAAVRLKTLGGHYEDVGGCLHIFAGPWLFVWLLFADHQPASNAEQRSPDESQHLARDQSLVKISRSVYRWWVAVTWLLAGTAAAVLFLLPTWTAGQAGAAWGILALIALHLIAAGLRFQALGKSCGYALLLFVPLIGQAIYVWLLFADQPGADYGAGSQNAGQTSDESKRTRAERIAAARSRSRSSSSSSPRPSTKDWFEDSVRSTAEKTRTKRPAAAEWAKAASDQMSKL